MISACIVRNLLQLTNVIIVWNISLLISEYVVRHICVETVNKGQEVNKDQKLSKTGDFVDEDWRQQRLKAVNKG